MRKHVAPAKQENRLMHPSECASKEIRPNRVRKLREDRLMTREELAERAGVSLRTVWSVEKGLPCRIVTRRKILQALGVTRRDRALVFPSIAGEAR
jgi:DNA-binding XRE family transcriptional regulator